MNNVHVTRQPNDKANLKNNDDGQIRKYYAGKQIFLTGCTGFLGTLILEKILRTCTEIEKIYIMIRPKKGVPIEERMKKCFQDVAFDKLREMNPNFLEKVVPIYGDLEKPDLALSPEDHRRLVKNVNIIIHNASVVYFHAKPSYLLRINVLGTKKLLELATECSRLEAFVYVSTAYSHLYNQQIEEEFYSPPADMKMIEDIIRADEENKAGITNDVLEEIVGKWTNLYTFSKATTEGLVEDFGRKKSLPCIIFRPSVVVEAYQEPIPAWMASKNGPVMLLGALTLGILHVAPTNDNIILDMIPVDLTTNSLLALIWDYVVHRKSKEPQVYNYGSSDWNGIRIKEGKKKYFKAMNEIPTTKMVWYPFLILTTNMYVFTVLHILLHGLPALIVDSILLVQGKKLKATSTFLKLSKNYKLLWLFISTEWTIKTDKLKDVRSRMNAADTKDFFFDLEAIDWYKVAELCMVTLRQILRDPLDTIPAAKKKYKKLMILHYTVCALLAIFSFFFLYRMMSNFLSY